jgi:predicted DNA-binding transcriptional regulator AlpA
MSTNDSRELLTSEETADLVRLPLSTLYVFNSQGVGPPRYKVGRRILYRRSEVMAWVESRRINPGNREQGVSA